MIYVMAELDFNGRETGLVKIGSVSTDDPDEAEVRIKKRLTQLQQGNPRRLSVIAVERGLQPHEKALHHRFAAYRVGGEWLRAAGELVSWIKARLLPRPVRFKSRADRKWEGFLKLWQRIAKKYAREAGYNDRQKMVIEMRKAHARDRAAGTCNCYACREEAKQRRLIPIDPIAATTKPSRTPPGRGWFLWRGQWRMSLPQRPRMSERDPYAIASELARRAKTGTT